MLVFYWDSDGIHYSNVRAQLLMGLGNQHSALQLGNTRASIVPLASQWPLSAYSSPPPALPPYLIMRASCPQCHRPMLLGLWSKRHVRGHSVPPISPRKPKGRVICPGSQIEMQRTRTGVQVIITETGNISLVTHPLGPAQASS